MTDEIKKMEDEAMEAVSGGALGKGNGYKRVMSFWSCLDPTKFRTSRQYEVSRCCEYCMHFITFPGSASSGFCEAITESKAD